MRINGKNHDELINMQGGKKDEYYHLTEDEHTNLTSHSLTSTLDYTIDEERKFIKDELPYPSISDSDDFTTDTSDRWAPVSGSVAYDTDHLNIITDGITAIRRRSYINEEGSQKVNVTLPIGTDGDYFTFVTHSPTATMDSGLGAGLISDGAGNWNFATIKGTTVTEGVASGLSDGDTATIEIEKDISGSYWYYVYDATGAKPTEATGKMFTTLNRGYTGFYCNGTAKIFAVDDFECRCNTIISDTNCESTEEYFFRDDANEDGIDKYSVTGTWGHSIDKYVCSVDGNIGLNNINVDDQDTLFNISIPNGDTNYFYFNGYRIKMIQGLTSCTITLESDDGIQVGSTSWINDVSAGTSFSVEVVTDDASCIIKDGNGLLQISEIIELQSAYDYWVGTDGTEIDLIQISGTRVYPTPMLRGTQVGKFNDGSEDVLCATYSDDMENFNPEEYTLNNTTYERENKKLICVKDDNPNILINGLTGTYGYTELILHRRSSWDTGFEMHFGKGKISYLSKYGYFYFNSASSADNVYVIDVGETVKLCVLCVETGYIITLKTVEDEVLFEESRLIEPNGTGECYFRVYNGSESKWELKGFSLHLLTGETPNDIAYGLPSVSHGGRYDIIENVTRTYPLNNIATSRLSMNTLLGKSTNPLETAKYYLTIKNDTDDTPINIDPENITKVTEVALSDEMKIEYNDELFTRFRDMDDNIIIKIDTDKQPDGIIYHSYANIKPITIITEDDLV